MTYPDVNLGVVLCVSRDEQGAITHLTVQGIFPDQVPTKIPRAVVVGQVAKGTVLCTVYRRKEDGKQALGPEIHAVKGKWLRTDHNDVEEDNLGEIDDC